MSDSTPDETPLIPAAALGYRTWTLENADGKWRLKPIAYSSLSWSPGDNHAICAEGGNHQAPDPNCHCGLYGVHEMNEVGTYHGLGLVGGVIGRGLLQVHHTGFRAETMRIIAFYIHDAKHNAAKQIARIYGVPLFHDPCEFQAYCLGIASPVPSAWRPGPPPPIPEYPENRTKLPNVTFSFDELVEMFDEHYREDQGS